MTDKPHDEPLDDGTWPLYDGGVPCVGSGLCCKKARCAIGIKVHGIGDNCPSLVERGGRYWCGEILKASPEEAVRLRRELYVGAGCCMPLFNDARERIIALGRIK